MKSDYSPVYPSAPYAEPGAAVDYYTPPPSTNPAVVLINGREILVPSELKDDVSSGQAELIREGMENHEARVCMVLDVSSSMQEKNKFFADDFKGNQIQTLINRALALAILFDDDKRVQVFPFGEKVFTVEKEDKPIQPLEIDANNFSKATDMILDLLGGSLRQHTNYSEPVKAIRKYYFNDEGPRTKIQVCDDSPVFVIFVTDGEPSEKKIEAMNQFRSASHQAIFFKFIALRGQQVDQEFKFLTAVNKPQIKSRLDSEEEGRSKFLIDNSNLVIFNDPRELTMPKLIEEYRPWLTDAYRQKILTHHPGIKFTDIASEGRVTPRLFDNKQNKPRTGDPVVKKKDSGCRIL